MYLCRGPTRANRPRAPLDIINPINGYFRSKSRPKIAYEVTGWPEYRKYLLIAEVKTQIKDPLVQEQWTLLLKTHVDLQ